MKGHIEPAVQFSYKHLVCVDDMDDLVKKVASLLSKRFDLKEVGSTAKKTRTRTSMHDVDYIVIFKVKQEEKKPKELRNEMYDASNSALKELRQEIKGSIVRTVLHSRTVKVVIQVRERQVIFDMMPAIQGGGDGEYFVPNERNVWKLQEKGMELRRLENPVIQKAVIFGKVVKDSYFPGTLPSCSFEFAVNCMSLSTEHYFKWDTSKVESADCRSAIVLYQMLSYLAFAAAGRVSRKIVLVVFLLLPPQRFFQVTHLHGKENMIPSKKGACTLLANALRGILHQLRLWFTSSSSKDIDLFLILTNQTSNQWNENRWVTKEKFSEIHVLTIGASGTLEFELQKPANDNAK